MATKETLKKSGEWDYLADLPVNPHRKTVHRALIPQSPGETNFEVPKCGPTTKGAVIIRAQDVPEWEVTEVRCYKFPKGTKVDKNGMVKEPGRDLYHWTDAMANWDDGSPEQT